MGKVIGLAIEGFCTISVLFPLFVEGLLVLTLRAFGYDAIEELIVILKQVHHHIIINVVSRALQVTILRCLIDISHSHYALSPLL
jgi:hypothetical protein